MGQKKSRVVIIHGTASNPNGNWFPWLAKRLESESVETIAPALPTPAGQTLLDWHAAFKSQVGNLEEHMLLVGHSIGCGFVLRLLERAKTPVKGCFLVSGWTGLLKNQDFDPLIETFFRERFDWETIRSNAGTVAQYHGDNDPYVPLELAKELSGNLGCKLNIIPEGGHLNTEAGYIQFMSLLEDCRALLRKE